MITSAVSRRQPTKERLLDAGMRLFAEQGFRETTVGEIEAAVGLEPRRGALYRHFRSKEALLEAALERHLRNVGSGIAPTNDAAVTDVRAEALVAGRWLLVELDREQAIVRILEQEGDRLVALRDSFRERLVDTGYVAAAALARRWLGASANRGDVEGVTVVLMGALVNYRRSTWTFGAAPLELDEERFLAAWADVCELVTTAAARTPRARR